MVGAADRRARRGSTSWHALFAGVIGAMVLASLVASTSAAASPAAGFPPRFAHVMVIIAENQSLDDILVKNPAAHYLVDQLTPAAALATQFYAPKRNSPTTYFAMSSGHTYTEGDGGGHWSGKCGPTPQCSSDDETVYEQLASSGRSWRIYSEDQTQPCQTTNVAKYWVGHNPAVWYTRLGPNAYTTTGDGSCLKYDVSLDALRADLAGGTVPDYSLVVPNDCHNMHDACFPIHDRVLQGNAWLEDVLAQDAIVPGGLIDWAKRNDTLLIITFDEARLDSDRAGCCPVTAKGGGGHIPTWILGPDGKVKASYRSKVPLSNYSILRQVEQNWDLPLLGHAADRATSDLSDFLIATSTKPTIPPADATSGEPGSSPSSGPAGVAAVSAPPASATPAPNQPAPTSVGVSSPARSAPAAMAAIPTVIIAIGTLALVMIAAASIVLRRRSTQQVQPPPR